jgi:acylphosphatase
MALCRLFTIKGRVQGVFFRDSTRRVAHTLGITGYAINLDDGSVEVLACGERAAIDKLAAWLQEGPQMARVDEVRSCDIEEERPSDFQIG